MNRKISFIIIISLIMIVFLPLVIDWLIIGNDFPSNISNSDWVGFFGGYLGSIIGSLVSLFGIIITIRFTKEQIQQTQAQYQEQKRLNCMPVLDFKIAGVPTEEDAGTLPMFVNIETRGEKRTILKFDIANVGLGAAINIQYSVESENQDGIGLWNDLSKRTIRSNCNEIQKIAFYTKPEMERLKLLIYYDDVLSNCYLKKVEIILHKHIDEDVPYILKQNNGELTEKPTTMYHVLAVKENSIK